jgi:hypothetical protein
VTLVKLCVSESFRFVSVKAVLLVVVEELVLRVCALAVLGWVELWVYWYGTCVVVPIVEYSRTYRQHKVYGIL